MLGPFKRYLLYNLSVDKFYIKHLIIRQFETSNKELIKLAVFEVLRNTTDFL